MKSLNKGFTLIELIFIIVIIGILAAVFLGEPKKISATISDDGFEKEVSLFAKEAKEFVEDARLKIQKMKEEPTKKENETTEWN